MKFKKNILTKFALSFVLLFGVIISSLSVAFAASGQDINKIKRKDTYPPTYYGSLHPNRQRANIVANKKYPIYPKVDTNGKDIHFFLKVDDFRDNEARTYDNPCSITIKNYYYDIPANKSVNANIKIVKARVQAMHHYGSSYDSGTEYGLSNGLYVSLLSVFDCNSISTNYFRVKGAPKRGVFSVGSNLKAMSAGLDLDYDITFTYSDGTPCTKPITMGSHSYSNEFSFDSRLTNSIFKNVDRNFDTNSLKALYGFKEYYTKIVGLGSNPVKRYSDGGFSPTNFKPYEGISYLSHSYQYFVLDPRFSFNYRTGPGNIANSFYFFPKILPNIHLYKNANYKNLDLKNLNVTVNNQNIPYSSSSDRFTLGSYSLPEGKNTITVLNKKQNISKSFTVPSPNDLDLNFEVSAVGRTEKASIPFEKKTVVDDDKWEDYKEITQIGVLGEKEVTKDHYLVTFLKTKEKQELGKASDAIKAEKVLKAPIDEITTIGGKKIIHYKEEIEESSISFKTIYEVDEHLENGQFEIKREGEVGTLETTYKDTYKKDDKIEREVVSSRVLVEPVDKIILVGIKPTIETVVIPHNTLEEKEGFDIIPGKDGSKNLVTLYKFDPETQEMTEETHEENIIDPVDDEYLPWEYVGDPEMEAGTERKEGNIIYKGTKTQTEKVIIPHNVLEEKEGFDIIPGKDGSKDIVTTYEVDPDTGEVSSNTHEENIVDPVDDEYLPWEYVGDPEMEAGTERKEGNIIYKGTKENRETLVISHNTLEEKEGFDIIPGEDGSKDLVTTYEVDPETGEVSSSTHEENIVPAVDDEYRKVECERQNIEIVNNNLNQVRTLPRTLPETGERQVLHVSLILAGVAASLLVLRGYQQKKKNG